MADFQENIERFAEIDVEVVALSVDSEEDARKMVDKHELTYPVLYGVDAVQTMASIGGYINEDPTFLHPSGFILRPDGTIATLVQSSGPIGRFTAGDTLAIIKHHKNTS